MLPSKAWRPQIARRRGSLGPLSAQTVLVPKASTLSHQHLQYDISSGHHQQSRFRQVGAACSSAETMDLPETWAHAHERSYVLLMRPEDPGSQPSPRNRLYAGLYLQYTAAANSVGRHSRRPALVVTTWRPAAHSMGESEGYGCEPGQVGGKEAD